MKKFNVATAARNLPDLVNRVATQGVGFELTRGGKRLARLVPSCPGKGLQVADLGALFGRLPRLDADQNAGDSLLNSASSMGVIK